MRVGVGAGSAQPGPDIVAVQPGSVRRVVRQGRRRVVARRHLLQPLQDAGPPLAERAAPGELRQHRRMQHVHVPGLGALAQQLADPARSRPGHPPLDPVPEVVQGGARHRGEGGDPALGAADRRELPGLDRAPVVPDHMHRPVRAHRVDDGQEVVGQLLQGEAAAQRNGCRRTAVTAHVVQHDMPPLGQLPGDLRPDLLAVRVAVHEHDRRTRRLAQLDDAQLDTARGHPALARPRQIPQTHAATLSSAQRRTCGRSSSSQKALCSGSRESVTTRISSNFAPVPRNPRCGSTAHRPGRGDDRRSGADSRAATSRPGARGPHHSAGP